MKSMGCVSILWKRLIRMQFSRDYRNGMGFSKYNLLAVSCAKYDHKSKYFDEASTDMVAVQCGDGHIIAPKDYESKRHVVILHDWDDSYIPALANSSKVIALGIFDVPERCIRINSFPLDNAPVLPINTHYDVLVAGVPVEQSMNHFGNMLGNEDTHKHIALFDNGENILKERCNALTDMVRNCDFISHRCSEMLINAYYRSAKTIFHTGSAGRGYLHALAVKYCNDVHTITGDNKFEPASMKDFLEILYA